MRATRRLVAAVGIAGAGALAGCLGYSPEQTPGGSDPVAHVAVFPAMEGVIVASLQHVMWRYPMDGPYSVNLPRGVTGEQAADIVRRLNDPNARVLTAENAGLPMVSVEKVVVVGDDAQAQVHRPVSMSNTSGIQLTRAWLVRSRGGLSDWHASTSRSFAVGSVPAPQPNIVEPAPVNRTRAKAIFTGD